MKNIKVSKELFSVIVRIMEGRINKKCDLNSVAHKGFIEFIKANFTGQPLNTSVKALIVSLMRTINKRFGEKALTEYP